MVVFGGLGNVLDLILIIGFAFYAGQLPSTSPLSLISLTQQRQHLLQIVEMLLKSATLRLH